MTNRTKSDVTKCVLMVCSQYPPIYGGAGTQAKLLSTFLVRRGWKAEVVTLNQSKRGTAIEDEIRVVRVFSRPSNGGFSAALSTAALSVAAAWRIAVLRPGVVHVHGTYWWSILPIIVGRLFGCVTILKSTRDGEDDPSTVRAKQVRGLKLGSLYGLSLRFADAIAVLNPSTVQSAVRAGVGGKTRLMRNGVDESVFSRSPDRRAQARRDLEVAPNTRVITFVGYLVRHKGVIDLVEAVKLLNPTNLEIWFVGPSTGFYRELTADVPLAIDSLKSAGYTVRMFGHKTTDEMPPIYWATDIFTLPSYAEGMPNSLAEAIVAGCGVVATDIPGIRDLFDPRDNARLVQAGDVSELADALRDGLQRGISPSSFTARSLSMNTVAEAYDSLYREMWSAK